MGKKRKKSPKISIASVLVALLVIIGSRFVDSDTNHNQNQQTSNNTQYETRVDKDDTEDKDTQEDKEDATSQNSDESSKSQDADSTQTEAVQNDSFDYNRDVPEYSGQPSVQVNNNTPYFPKPTSTAVYKNYADLDNLNRVGPCEVVTGPEYLPKEKRGDISHVKPTGWRQKKYDFVDGKYLYNRCHLIGYQIAGDNDNWKNLMTGTRYMNVDGMLPYENEVAQYIKSTRHHVKYRVSPIFLGNDKVARGVLMEAYSVEDNRLKFNAFCYNVQPRVTIDYATGYSKLAN